MRYHNIENISTFLSRDGFSVGYQRWAFDIGKQVFLLLFLNLFVVLKYIVSRVFHRRMHCSWPNQYDKMCMKIGHVNCWYKTDRLRRERWSVRKIQSERGQSINVIDLYSINQFGKQKKHCRRWDLNPKLTKVKWTKQRLLIEDLLIYRLFSSHTYLHIKQLVRIHALSLSLSDIHTYICMYLCMYDVPMYVCTYCIGLHVLYCM